MKKIIIVSAVVLLIASAVYILVWTDKTPLTAGEGTATPAAGAAKQAATQNTQANSATSAVDATASTQAAEADDTPELSPEMKESLRKMLFQHGPKTTIQHPDGRIEMPMNGRYTQMPVAIQKPDGTIVIREYSVVPENKNEKP